MNALDRLRIVNAIGQSCLRGSGSADLLPVTLTHEQWGHVVDCLGSHGTMLGQLKVAMRGEPVDSDVVRKLVSVFA